MINTFDGFLDRIFPVAAKRPKRRNREEALHATYD
jgi:hypothetical protein